VYACGASSPLGPFDVARATHPVGEPWHYSGRLVSGRDGEPRFLAFVNDIVDGEFVGALRDPFRVAVDGAGRLRVIPG
jgi:hypothetical protein